MNHDKTLEKELNDVVWKPKYDIGLESGKKHNFLLIPKQMRHLKKGNDQYKPIIQTLRGEAQFISYIFKYIF